MTRQQKVILAVLGVLLVVVWSRALLSGRSGRSSSSASHPDRLRLEEAEPGASAHRLQAMELEEGPAEPMAPVPDYWGESPFLSERGARSAALLEEEASSKGEFVLNGILWDPKRPSAIINNRVVSRGAHFGKWEVSEIERDRVLMSDGSEKKVLSSPN